MVRIRGRIRVGVMGIDSYVGMFRDIVSVRVRVRAIGRGVVRVTIIIRCSNVRLIIISSISSMRMVPVHLLLLFVVVISLWVMLVFLIWSLRLSV